MALLAAGGFGLTGVGLADGYRFEVNRYRHPLAGLSAPVRVAHLTDLHYGLYIQEGSLEEWATATRAEAPDLVLVTGDFVDTRGWGSLELLTRALSRLNAPLGVWAVWGNHDYHNYFFPLEGVRKHLERAGVRVLVNEGVRLRDDLFLAGLDDFLYGRPNLVAALSQRPEGAATLLMSHNPDVLPRVPAAVGLTLCGHTHGGQVKLPGVGPLVTSSRYGTRFAEGWVEAPAQGFVSRGLGFSLLPVRLNCRAELVVFDLVPA